MSLYLPIHSKSIRCRQFGLSIWLLSVGYITLVTMPEACRDRKTEKLPLRVAVTTRFMWAHINWQVPCKCSVSSGHWLPRLGPRRGGPLVDRHYKMSVTVTSLCRRHGIRDLRANGLFHRHMDISNLISYLTLWLWLTFSFLTQRYWILLIL